MILSTVLFGTKEAESIVPGVAGMIREFDGKVIATRDTHGEDYLSSAEGKISWHSLCKGDERVGNPSRDPESAR